MAEPLIDPVVMRLVSELDFGPLEKASENAPLDEQVFAKVMDQFPEYARILAQLSRGDVSYEEAKATIRSYQEKINAAYVAALNEKEKNGIGP